MMPTMMPSFYFEQMVPSISSSSSSSSCSSSPAASVLVEKATSYLLIDPDWTLNMEICDSINSSDRYCAHNSQFFFFFLKLTFGFFALLGEIRASISCLVDVSTL